MGYFEKASEPDEQGEDQVLKADVTMGWTWNTDYLLRYHYTDDI